MLFERPANPSNPANLESKKTYKELFISKADQQGMLPVGEFATKVLKLEVEPQDIATLLDGKKRKIDVNNIEAPEINLGQGLRFNGTSEDYLGMNIHIDDLDEFVRRVKIYFGE